MTHRPSAALPLHRPARLYLAFRAPASDKPPGFRSPHPPHKPYCKAISTPISVNRVGSYEKGLATVDPYWRSGDVAGAIRCKKENQLSDLDARAGLFSRQRDPPFRILNG